MANMPEKLSEQRKELVKRIIQDMEAAAAEKAAELIVERYSQHLSARPAAAA